MKLCKASIIALGLTVFGMAFTAIAKADEWNKKTTISFSAPVEIPGVHL